MTKEENDLIQDQYVIAIDRILRGAFHELSDQDFNELLGKIVCLLQDADDYAQENEFGFLI